MGSVLVRFFGHGTAAAKEDSKILGVRKYIGKSRTLIFGKSKTFIFGKSKTCIFGHPKPVQCTLGKSKTCIFGKYIQKRILLHPDNRAQTLTITQFP